MKKYILSIFLSLGIFSVGPVFIDSFQKNSDNYPPSLFISDTRPGVISGNMDDADTAHELLVDFGAKGVWFYLDAGGPWMKVSPDNPDFMVGTDVDGNGDMEVIVDFGIKGLWAFEYDHAVNWYKVTTDSPEEVISLDDDGDGADELHIDFGSGKGLWRYDLDSGWKKLTRDNPGFGMKCDFWNTGVEEGIWTFYNGTYAVWGSTPTWDKMTNDGMAQDSAAAEMGIGDDSQELAADFISKGLWGINKESFTDCWIRLTSDEPYALRSVRFVGDPDSELLCVFAVSGLWMWDDSGGSFPGTWTKLSGDNPDWLQHFCEPFDPDGTTELSGDEEAAIDFGIKGLWLYDSTAVVKWKKLTQDSPRFMVRSDLFGDGVDNCLICDFTSKGLWYYSGKTGTWHRMTGDSPDPS